MQSLRDFVGVDLALDPVPDETTILNSHHLLERHALTEALFEAVKSELEERAFLLRGGTIMDATLIDASSSTKNRSGKRDPYMSQLERIISGILALLSGFASKPLPGSGSCTSAWMRNPVSSTG